jgi:4,5-DOPA dioxygenase extradiol
MNAATPLPSLFVSHGSPMTVLEKTPATAFFAALGPALAALHAQGRKPRAVLAISAHTLTREPVLLAAPKHETVHDFGGFPDELYRMQYAAPGAPELAQRVAALLHAADLPAHVLPEGGLDHGIWTPLTFIYPQVDVPVLPLGFPPNWSPARLFELGQALAPLADEGVLVMGTGSITHNLRLLSRFTVADTGPATGIPEDLAFRDWFVQKGATPDWPALFNYRREAPHAVLMHPTDEHLLPWYVAAGVGGEGFAPLRLHESVAYGALGMDAYAFGPRAPALRAALPA